MKTFVIIMWMLNLATLEGEKKQWKGDLQSCLKAAYEYNEDPKNKHTFAGCYPHFIEKENSY